MGAVNNFRHAGRAVNGRIYNHCNLNKQLLASKLQLSAEKVNNLLECKVSMPELRRENPALFAYTPSLNVISYPRRYSIYEVEQELMHEYCHAMQFSAPYPFSWLKNKLLGEGFAEAVSRHLMVKSSPFQREAARIMLKHSVNNLLREDDLDIYLYDFGFAAFFLVQQKHGAGIYKEIIRTEKPFEYLLDHL